MKNNVAQHGDIGQSKGKTRVLRTIKAVYLLMCTGLFLVDYYIILHNFGQQSHFNHPKANILFILLYILSLLWLIRVYNGFYFGTSGVDLALSLILATTIINFCMYVVLCIYLNRFVNLLYMVILCIEDIPLDILCAWLGNKIFFYNNVPLKTAVVYRNLSDLGKIREIEMLPRNFNVVAYIENPKSAEELFPHLEGVQAVFVAGVKPRTRNGITKYCVDHDIQAYIEPKIGDVLMAGGKYVSRFSVPIIRVGRANPSPEFLFTKRVLDILISLFAIIILSPFMLVSAILIKIGDGGPVLYKQVRLTRNGEKFKILKFRSMRVDAEKDGVARLAKENDDRITPVGHFLRACRMDELPQLFNVLKGDMSIVGPRPERPEIAEQYKKEIPSFDLRLQVKAGITGFAQVYGKYNTEPYDKLQMDLFYINNQSLTNDLWLMLATIKVLFQKESTHGVDSAQVTAVKSGAGEENTNTVSAK